MFQIYIIQKVMLNIFLAKYDQFFRVGAYMQELP